MVFQKKYYTMGILCCMVVLKIVHESSHLVNPAFKRANSIRLRQIGDRIRLRRKVKVYTFFDNLDHVLGKEAPGKRTFQSDREILQAWKEAWSSMGYSPQVLTMEDAQRHPDYVLISEVLDQLAPILLGNNVAYDKACYLRWLAMATSGGFFLSDFDTVPLTPPDYPHDLLPPDKFRLYQQSIPSLMKGTSEQWTQMAHFLLHQALRYSHHHTSTTTTTHDITTSNSQEAGKVAVLYSDMMALHDLRHNETTKQFLMDYDNQEHSPVADGKRMLQKDKQFTDDDCHILAQQRAIHFHHGCESISNSLIDELMEDTVPYQSRRSIYMTKWPSYYQQHLCPS